LQVSETDLQPYRDLKDETTAKVYAMVSNIDHNVGRLLKQLPQNTIIVFLTDNGPQQPRFNSGMRDRKGSVHDGGICVPFFVRWPGKLQAGREVTQIAAHIDLAPTLLEACGIAKPPNAVFDGVSLWPLLTGKRVQGPERTLYFQWHRGDAPELHRAFAARSSRFKLVQPLGVTEKWDGKKMFQLFDMEKDPGEQNDLSSENTESLQQMLAGYERWFAEMKSARGFALPRITVGATNENPVMLTRQDWRGPEANWATNGLGHWDVEIAQTSIYEIQLLLPKLKDSGVLHFRCQGEAREQELSSGATRIQFKNVNLKRGPAKIEAWVQNETRRSGVHYVIVERKVGKGPH
jgi:hypothetical protein